MFRKTFIILSLIGLLLGVGVWTASNRTLNLAEVSAVSEYRIPSWLAVLVGVLCVIGFVGVVVLIVKIDKRNLLRHRQRLKLCKECGYDLRGSQQRCPECRTAFDLAQAPLNQSRVVGLLNLTTQHSTTFLILCTILLALLAGMTGNLVRYLKS